MQRVEYNTKLATEFDARMRMLIAKVYIKSLYSIAKILSIQSGIQYLDRWKIKNEFRRQSIMYYLPMSIDKACPCKQKIHSLHHNKNQWFS